ncbi:MAG: LysR family transcriptional regulator [Candidatus Faecimonas sp.]|nr:LysR family transcriptional regulator [Mycoplasmatota bacterium]MDY2908770.1 LysR family transcriptional regulator [Candidatus Faecimonas sp.]
MNIDFELYRIFYVVAKNRNITKASKELNISQPAISKSIKNLEEQLGGQLFFRTKRGVILTDEGKEFYKYISQAIEYIYNAENKFSDLVNLETGCIKIGISTTLTKEFLLPYLEKFHYLYPKIDIQIVTSYTDDLMTKLKNGLIDILILNLNNKNYGNDIEIIKCRKIQDCFVVGEKFKSLASQELSFNELNNYPLLLQAKGSSTREFLDDMAKTNNITLKPNIELASYSLVSEFVKIGFGIGYVTRDYVKSAIKNKELFELNLKEKIPNRYIGIALSKNHIPSFSTRKIIKIITEK